jgi:hypothetical protein
VSERSPNSSLGFFIAGGGKFRVLSRLSLVLVPEVRFTNLVKS